MAAASAELTTKARNVKTANNAIAVDVNRCYDNVRVTALNAVAIKFMLFIIVPRHEKIFFLLSENKGADRRCEGRAAERRLCFRYIYSTIHLLPKS